MARTFKRHRQTHPISELNVTNLIDLGFTLLIIFMIATPLINQEQTVPVNLPLESKSAQVVPEKNTKFVAITIDAKGNYYVDNAQLSFRELTARLKSYGANPKETVIRIRADGAVPYQKIMTVVDEVKKNGLYRFNFDTQAGS